MFVTISGICAHQRCASSVNPIQRTQRRASSKFCGMFWVTDSERVIDDHPTQPITMTAETWKDRKDSMEYSNGRTWHYHGVNGYALRTRSSVLHRFWRDHISGKKRPQRLKTDVCKSTTRSTESYILFFNDSNGLMGWEEGWNEEK